MINSRLDANFSVAETRISVTGRAPESAREVDSPLSTQLDSAPAAEAVGEEVFLTEAELSKRWSVSKKTLQRWRTIGYGIPHLKLSRKVLYKLKDVVAFETSSMRISTSEPFRQ